MSPRGRVSITVTAIAALGLALVCGKVVSKHLDDSAQARKTWAESLIPQDDKASVAFLANGRANRNLVVSLRSLEFNSCEATLAAINDHPKFLAVAYRHGFETLECDSKVNGRAEITQTKIVPQKPVPRVPE